jgi:hypothetical protein
MSAAWAPFRLEEHFAKFEHRLSLALLWNGCGPDMSRDVVRTTFPRRDPKQLIAQWIDEVSAAAMTQQLGGIEWRGVTGS